jgi:DNA-binding transcriptional ArsR family regulator
MLTSIDIQKNRKLFSENDENITATFKALSDLNRYRIFRILVQQPKLSVSSIALILDISLPLASQHIKVLTNANLLQKERRGKQIFPKLEHDNPFVKGIIKTIHQAID